MIIYFYCWILLFLWSTFQQDAVPRLRPGPVPRRRLRARPWPSRCSRRKWRRQGYRRCMRWCVDEDAFKNASLICNSVYVDHDIQYIYIYIRIFITRFAIFYIDSMLLYNVYLGKPTRSGSKMHPLTYEFPFWNDKVIQRWSEGFYPSNPVSQLFWQCVFGMCRAAVNDAKTPQSSPPLEIFT